MDLNGCGCAEGQIVVQPQFAVEPGTVFVDETTGITAFVDESGTLVVGLPPEEEIVDVIMVAEPEGQELLGAILPSEEELAALLELEPVVTVLEQPIVAAPLAATTGTLRFIVQDGVTMLALAGASVSVAGRSGVTGADGTVVFADLAAGVQFWTVTAPDHVDQSGAATVIAGEIQFALVRLEPVLALPGPRTPPPCSACDLYTVQPGDSLGEIALTFETTVGDILAVNPQITDPDLIIIGETINIPAAVTGPLTGTMTFVVLDGSGAPAPNAIVFFAGAIQATAADGRTTFAAVPTGEFPWTVTLANHVTQSGTATVVVNTSRFTTVALARTVSPPLTGTLLVSVRDADTNEGLDSALVVAAGQTRLTGAAGEALFEDLPGGVYEVIATHASHDPGTATVFVPAGGTGQATLLLRGTGVDLQVSVFDATGDPPLFPALAGVLLTLGDQGQQQTDATGIAVFRDVPVDTPMLLAAQLERFRQTTSEVVTVSAAEAPLAIRELLLVSSGTAELRLTVLDADTGDVIPGAAVELALANDVVAEITDANGLAVFPALVPASYQVTVGASGFDPGTEIITLSAGEVREIDARLLRVGGPQPVPEPLPGPAGGGVLLPLLAVGGVALFAFGRRGGRPAPAATERV